MLEHPVLGCAVRLKHLQRGRPDRIRVAREITSALGPPRAGSDDRHVAIARGSGHQTSKLLGLIIGQKRVLAVARRQLEDADVTLPGALHHAAQAGGVELEISGEGGGNRDDRAA